MIKDIYYNLQRYYTEHGYREICAFAVFIALAVGVYVFADNLDVTDNLKIEYSRYAVMSIWIVFCGAITYFTAFHHYTDIRISYSEMLYPSAPKAKYLSVFLRCLIFLPWVSVGVLLIIDSIWMYNSYPDTEAESFIKFMMSTGEPLNYLPLFPFYMLWLSSVAFMGALYPRLVSVALLVIAIFSMLILPGFNSSGYYPFVALRVVYQADGIRWSSMYSCLGAGTTTGYLISYLWLFGLPSSVLVLSYYRFKESVLS